MILTVDTRGCGGYDFETASGDLIAATDAATIGARVQSVQRVGDLLDDAATGYRGLVGDRVDARQSARLQFAKEVLSLLKKLLEVCSDRDGIDHVGWVYGGAGDGSAQ